MEKLALSKISYVSINFLDLNKFLTCDYKKKHHACGIVFI